MGVVQFKVATRFQAGGKSDTPLDWPAKTEYLEFRQLNRDWSANPHNDCPVAVA